MRLRAAALSSALLVACQGTPPTDGNANNLTLINDAAADEEARVNSQPAEIPPPPLAGEARVDALLAALRDGDQAAAHRLVGDVGHVASGIVSNENEFIARVLRCEIEDVRTRRAAVRFSVTWNCPRRGSRSAARYTAAIATGAPFATADGPLTILEFAEAAPPSGSPQQ